MRNSKRIDQIISGIQSEPERKAEKLNAEIKSNRKRIKELTDLLIEVRDDNDWKPPHVTKRSSKSDTSYTRLVIPDSHGNWIDRTAANVFLNDMESLRLGIKDQIVMLGDHVEAGGFLAERHVIGYVAEKGQVTYRSDIASANWFLNEVQKRSGGADIIYCEGNHECVTPDCEVLTGRGWVKIPDVTDLDLVATMNDRGETEFMPPRARLSYHHEGDMVSHNGPAVRFLVTPNHRFWYWSQSEDEILCRKAYRMVNFGFYGIPTSAKNKNPEAPYLDDELRFLGWVLTDGSYSHGSMVIYQSKPERVVQIRELLNRLGYAFSETVRNRRPSPGIKTALPSHIFRIKQSCVKIFSGRLFEIENMTSRERHNKKIPSYLSKLSERQFDVFYESVIDGDGTRVGDADCLFGRTEFLDAMQALLVVNGYRASLSRRHRKTGSWYDCLNITKRKLCKISGRNIKKQKYSGMVYCLTTDNDNFFVRYRGRVQVTGNSRVERWCATRMLSTPDDSQFLYDLIAPENLLKLRERGIRYVRTSEKYDGLDTPGIIRLGKCFFTHGFMHGINAARDHVVRAGGNIVFGHIHRIMSHQTSTLTGTFSGWSPGCLAIKQRYYEHSRPNDHGHGYAIQTVDKRTGDFLHLNIPIIGARSFLMPLARGIK